MFPCDSQSGSWPDVEGLFLDWRAQIKHLHVEHLSRPGMARKTLCVFGCMKNFRSLGLALSCVVASVFVVGCGGAPLEAGCTYFQACNYQPSALVDDGTSPLWQGRSIWGVSDLIQHPRGLAIKDHQTRRTCTAPSGAIA